MKADLTEVEDVDPAEAIIDLKAQEAAFEAALAVTGKAVQSPLVDLLR